MTRQEKFAVLNCRIDRWWRTSRDPSQPITSHQLISTSA